MRYLSYFICLFLLSCGARDGVAEYELKLFFEQDTRFAEGRIAAYRMDEAGKLRYLNEVNLSDKALSFNADDEDVIVLQVHTGQFLDSVSGKVLQLGQGSVFQTLIYAKEIKQFAQGQSIGLLSTLQAYLIQHYKNKFSVSIHQAINIVREDMNNLFGFDIVFDGMGDIGSLSGSFDTQDRYALLEAAFLYYCSYVSFESNIQAGTVFHGLRYMELLSIDFYDDGLIDHKRIDKPLEFRSYIFKNFREELLFSLNSLLLDTQINKTGIRPIEAVEWLKGLESKESQLFQAVQNTYFNANVPLNEGHLISPDSLGFVSNVLHVLIEDSDNQHFVWIDSIDKPIRLNKTEYGQEAWFSLDDFEEGEHTLYIKSLASNGESFEHKKIIFVHKTKPQVNLSFFYEGQEAFAQSLKNDTHVRKAFYIKANIDTPVVIAEQLYRIDGQEFVLEQALNSEQIFLIPIESVVTQEGYFNFEYYVKDHAGNETRIDLSLVRNLIPFEISDSIDLSESSSTSYMETKIINIGDINQDGHTDIFKHSSNNVHIVFGPDYKTIWNVPGSWQHSMVNSCDVNGDGAVDLVLGKGWHDDSGLTILFGPMQSNGEFSKSYVHGHQNLNNPSRVYMPGSGPIACLRQAGTHKDTILHFPLLSYPHESGVFWQQDAGELEFYNYQNNSLQIRRSADFNGVLQAFPNGIRGFSHSQFSQPQDINQDGFMDIYINAFFHGGDFNHTHSKALYGTVNGGFTLNATVNKGSRHLKQKFDGSISLGTDFNNHYSIYHKNHIYALGESLGQSYTAHIRTFCHHATTCLWNSPHNSYLSIANDSGIVHTSNVIIEDFSRFRFFKAELKDFDGDGIKDIILLQKKDNHLQLDVLFGPYFTEKNTLNHNLHQQAMDFYNTWAQMLLMPKHNNQASMHVLQESFKHSYIQFWDIP